MGTLLIFMSPNEDGTTILRGHPSHAKVSPLALQREYLHFSVIFKTLSNGPAPGIKLATSRSEVKHSTDWTTPAMVKLLLLLLYYKLVTLVKHIERQSCDIISTQSNTCIMGVLWQLNMLVSSLGGHLVEFWQVNWKPPLYLCVLRFLTLVCLV